MRKRTATIIAAAALMIVSAAPALAAPGGIPGPPDNPGGDHAAARGADADSESTGLPTWAKAYGKRIIDEFGMPYGQLLKCSDDFVADEGETAEESDADEGEAAEESEAKFAECPDPEDFEFPDEPGASALGLALFFTESGELIVAL